MKIFLKTFIISALTISSLQVQGQVKFGAKAGLNINSVGYSSKDSDDEEEMRSILNSKAGYHFGAFIDYSFSDALSIRPELLFSSKGYSFDIEKIYGDGGAEIEGYMRTTFNYLEIPINVAYKINDFQIFAGPYIAFGLGGRDKMKLEVDGESLEEKIKLKPKFGKLNDDDFEDEDEDEDDYDYFKAFDFGLNLGFGYAFGPISVNAAYSLGLGNTIPKYEGYEDTDKERISNRLLSFSVAYTFGE